MSEQERHADRAEGMQDEAGSTTEEETPDVEAHRFDTHGRVEAGRNDLGTETEDRHRNSDV